MHRHKRRSKQTGVDQDTAESVFNRYASLDSTVHSLLNKGQDITGEFYIVPQKYLCFGSDRKQPTKYRPGVLLTRRFTGAYIAPCTSKFNSSFFKVSRDSIRWKEKNTKSKRYSNSYISPQYEKVMDVILQMKGVVIGRVKECCRCEISEWLQRSCNDDSNAAQQRVINDHN